MPRRKIRISQQVWGAFEFNISRARALALAQHYLQVLVEEGEEAVISYLNQVMGRFLSLVGFDLKSFVQAISQAAVEPVRREIERQFGGLTEKELEKRLAKFKGHEDQLEEEMRDLLEPFIALELLAQQTLVESAVVMAVTSYEAFMRDIIAAEARRRPSILEQFPDVQKEVNFRTIKFYGGKARLAQAELVARSLDAFSTGRVRSYFKRVYGVENVFKTGELEREIHRMIQIRNLIVHRGGVIDREFRRATGSKEPLGSRITLPYRSVTRGIAAIQRFGEILKTDSGS